MGSNIDPALDELKDITFMLMNLCLKDKWLNSCPNYNCLLKNYFARHREKGHENGVCHKETMV